MSYIGIDYGTKRVGVAVSDEQGRVAFPLQVVPQQEALARVRALALQRNAKMIVIGESKNFAGQENPVMKDIQNFIAALQENATWNVVLEPEFMTSAQAGREGEMTKENLDASAAALILQSFLDKRQKDTI